MKIENVKITGFEGALRGMRNPKNSWHLNDSKYGFADQETLNDLVYSYLDKYKEAGLYNLSEDGTEEDLFNYIMNNFYEMRDNGIIKYNAIGPKDLKLAMQLIASGPEHRKFLRQIQVSMDITAPLYWWKEMDTYKVGTTANSTSTMHKLTSKPITLYCFEIDDMPQDLYIPCADQSSVTEAGEEDNFEAHWHLEGFREHMFEQLEDLRQAVINTEDAELKQQYWKELVRWLPESWLQTRTWTGNYETLRNIYHQRRNHKLSEWRRVCHTFELFPYATEFITYEN